MTKALVIGYGSIGRRHSEVLQSMEMISEVSVLSGQENLLYRTIRSLEEIESLAPDYIVIASNTLRHFEELCFLEDNFKDKTILVEKPLFGKYHDLIVQNNSVWVGYSLRFHPLMQLIRKKIERRNLWNISVFCGSYLPEWRPGRDYRTTSSAMKDSGGGVLLDLSHELDYVQWLAGKIIPEYIVNEKISDLDIETDDFLMLAGRSEHGVVLQISLNYFTRKPVRQIIIDGEGISIQADLITSTATVLENGSESCYSWDDFSRDDECRTEHCALLSGDFTNACSYQEGQDLMRLVDVIRNWEN